jgi:putative transposase
MARKKRNRKGIKRYPTDFSQKRWEIIKDLLPDAAPGGRPRTINMRKLLNAILYVTRGGIAWRLLPLEFPPWQTVYGYFRRWTENGTWKRIHDALRDRTRRKAGREECPTAACLDSQSVKTTALAGEKGYARARKSTGASGMCW